MQLLVGYAAAAGPDWRAVFDARAEARALAGVNLLQIWREADDPGALLCLFELRDRARAEDWLKVETALHGASAPRFLRTV